MQKLWYEHKPESVGENENAKILWDMKIKLDVTCPFDTRILQKEREK